MDSNNIKILHVVSGIDDGGLEKVVYMIISENVDSKFEHHITVLVKKTKPFLEDELKKLGCHIHYFNITNKEIKSISVLINIKEIVRLSRLYKKYGITIIHSHDFFPAFCARLAAVISYLFFFYKVKHIFITLHNSFFWLNKFHHLTNRFLSLFTSKIVCVSESVYRFSKERDKIKEAKYMIIYNGVDENQYIPNSVDREEYRELFDLPSDALILGNVGVLSIRKGQKYLIEAFQKLAVSQKNLYLLIFGSPRSHEENIAEEIYEQIQNYNLSSRVFIIEPRKDLNRIYNLFDIFVMPSITEGLSLSVIEAMLMSKICLLSDIPSFAEMVEDGRNAFLFNSKDVESLAARLEYIIANFDQLQDVGKHARSIALKKYSLKRMGEEYRSLYLQTYVSK